MKRNPLIKFVLLVIIMAFLIPSCKEDDVSSPTHELSVAFNSFGLTGKTVNKLYLKETKLYAATDQGLYVNDFVNGWSLLGFENENVQALEFLNNTKILCSTIDIDNESYKLFKSVDLGFSWQEIQSNFGGEIPEPIRFLKYNSDSNELIAIGNGAITHSFDEGETWVQIYNDWHGSSTMDFIELNPHNNELWASGQNAIEQMYTIHINNNREFINLWLDQLPTPSTGKSIAFHSMIEEELLIGGESGIIHTINNGETWSNIYPQEVWDNIYPQFDNVFFFFGVDYDNQKPSRIIAASWDKALFNDPQPLIIHISEDNGDNWQIHINNEPNLFGGVWDMLQTQENGKTVLYLGLDKGGVYKAVLQEIPL